MLEILLTVLILLLIMISGKDGLRRTMKLWRGSRN